jgi:hypothetical protein
VGGARELAIDPILLLPATVVPLTTVARFLGALVSQCLADDEIPLVHRQMFSDYRYLASYFDYN